jgi:hypothetical protein
MCNEFVSPQCTDAPRLGRQVTYSVLFLDFLYSLRKGLEMNALDGTFLYQCRQYDWSATVGLVSRILHSGNLPGMQQSWDIMGIYRICYVVLVYINPHKFNATEIQIFKSHFHQEFFCFT